MADLIEDIKSNPIVYYVGLLIGVALLFLIIYLIVKNDKTKKEKVKEANEEKARIEKHVDLEGMIAKMQEQEQNKLKDADPVANFEQEQEEQAIISYQELVKAVKSDNKEPINVINVSSEGNVLSTTTVARNKVPQDKPIFIDEIKLPKSEIEFDSIDEQFQENSINFVQDVVEKLAPPKDNSNLEKEKEEKYISFFDQIDRFSMGFGDENKEEQETTSIRSFDDIINEQQIDDKLNNIENNTNMTVRLEEVESVIEKTEKEPMKPESKIEEFKRVDDVTPVKEIVESKPEEKTQNSKFRNSEFISPIYGRQNNNISYPKISSLKDTNTTNEEQVINIDDDGINDEFLKTLMDFRNN